nr:hypothetical protein [Nitrospirota bacterium]
MYRLAAIAGFIIVTTAFTTAMAEAASVPESTGLPPGMAMTQVTPGSGTPAQAGRFQLIVVPGQNGSPFLLDTATGCLWHQYYHQQTNRTTFIEVDVENLHWGWGTGAQQLLASRIEATNLSDEQKRTLKDNLQKTTCGSAGVMLTPGAAQAP